MGVAGCTSAIMTKYHFESGGRARLGSLRMQLVDEAGKLLVH
jgi:hypothetical protein